MYISAQMQQRLASALRAYPVQKAQLFGSRARGEAKADSDYDLILHFDKGYVPSLFELGGIHHTLTEALKANVDVVPYRSSLSPEILKDAKTVFERR